MSEFGSINPMQPETEQVIARDIVEKRWFGNREIPYVQDTPLLSIFHPIQYLKALYERYLWAPTSVEMHGGREE